MMVCAERLFFVDLAAHGRLPSCRQTGTARHGGPGTLRRLTPPTKALGDDREIVGVTLEEARIAYILGSLDALLASANGQDIRSPSWLVLQAAIDQCHGDVPTALRRFQRLAQRVVALPEDLADLYGILLVSTGHSDDARAAIGPAHRGERGPRLALRAVLEAFAMRTARSREFEASALDAEVDSDVDRLLIAQRLAFAAYQRGDHADATELGRQARALAQRLCSPRAEAAALTIEYAAAHAGFADGEQAFCLAQALVAAARRGGDRSRQVLGEVALYEMAVERAELSTADALAKSFAAEPLANQYREQFTHYFSDVCLALLHRHDYGAAVAQLSSIESMVAHVGARSLCKALRALCFAALDDVVPAKRDVRQALDLTARPPAGISPGELRERRLARAIAIATGFLLGDVARGHRRLDAAFMRANCEVAAVVRAAEGSVPSPPATVAGYVQLVLDAAAHRRRALSPAPLTPSERDVLGLLAAGRTTHDISVLRSCSPYTTRTHVRNAIAKLGARGKLDAIARARGLGIFS